MNDAIREMQAAMERHGYIAEHAIATAVYLAKEMRKPLLIEGDASVGKTEIGKVLARMLDTELIRLQCYQGLDVNTALYEWNYQAALLQMLRSVQSFYNQQSTATGAPSGGGLSMPYTVREEAVTSGANVNYNGYAHSFGGMGVQFLLFAMANLGIEMLLERQRGLWKRLRSAPVSRLTLLGGKVASGTLISLLTLWVSFAFAMIVFRVRIQGSVLGFIGVSIACALMAATFGLLVAALGRTPASARGVTILAVLMMVMLGGAWVPAFVFPGWLQQATKILPVRWAVDGLDAMTWRGLGISGALAPTLVLLGFAAIFGAVAAARFRWEET